MNVTLKFALAAAGLVVAGQAAAQVTFFEREGFEGRSFTTSRQVDTLDRYGFNDRASSVVVDGRDRWEVCDDAGFAGKCVILRPGRYPSLAALGLENRVSSTRTVGREARVEDNRYAPPPVAPQVIFYEREGFTGRSFAANEEIRNLERSGFNDRASSAVVVGAPWEVCDDARFRGNCVVLRPGQYPNLAAMSLNDRITSTRIVSPTARIPDNRFAPPPVVPQVTFYEHEGFAGRSFAANQEIRNFEQSGFNDRASSAVVVGTPWEVCDNSRFEGRCVVLRPGEYPNLSAMGLNDRISSTRIASPTARIPDNRYSPAPVATYDYRRRGNERLYEAEVTGVRAVLGTPEQRCWVEREQIAQERSQANVPAAIAGAVIGGILGHQVGSGRGNDLATVGGAVAGAAVGANVGRSGGQSGSTQDVKRCENVAGSARPDYWDVTYNFRGREGHVQMTTPPGSTITVNEQGEPRA